MDIIWCQSTDPRNSKHTCKGIFGVISLMNQILSMILQNGVAKSYGSCFSYKIIHSLILEDRSKKMCLMSLKSNIITIIALHFLHECKWKLMLIFLRNFIYKLVSKLTLHIQRHFLGVLAIDDIYMWLQGKWYLNPNNKVMM